MRNCLSVIIILSLCCGISFGTDWEEELKSDVVQIVDGKMMMEEYVLIKGSEESTLQMKIYAEAPTDGSISRDNFIGLSTLLYLPALLEMGEFESIDEPIGNLDVEMNMYMTARGIQIEFKDNINNQTSRETQTWAQVYGQ